MAQLPPLVPKKFNTFSDLVIKFVHLIKCLKNDYISAHDLIMQILCNVRLVSCAVAFNKQMEEDNIFIRAALSKRVQLPSTSARTVSELNADCLAVYNEPSKKTKKSNAPKHGEKYEAPK